MEINLIPVIEITRWSDNIPLPNESPFWEYPDIYDIYNEACLAEAGFPDKMTPYLKGSSFYRLTEVSDANLLLQIGQRTEGYEPEEVCPFDGGYVLNIDGEDRLFPQCCGDLEDIQYWQNIVEGKKEFWQGHPGPVLSFHGNSIRFDLTTGEYDETFVPIPVLNIFEVDRQALSKAVERAKEELTVFARRLVAINEKEGLNIDGIDELLTGINSSTNH